MMDYELSHRESCQPTSAEMVNVCASWDPRPVVVCWYRSLTRASSVIKDGWKIPYHLEVLIENHRTT